MNTIPLADGAGATADVLASTAVSQAVARCGCVSDRRAVVQGLGTIVVARAIMPMRAAAEAGLPQPIVNNLVNAAPARWNGRDCLAVELTDEEQRRRLAKPRAAGRATYAVVFPSLGAGAIEADVGAELNRKGGAGACGFVGLAFHVSSDLHTYEAVCLRMSNGRLNDPPPPRIERAIEYAAHPDFRYDASRSDFPGRHENGADIAIGRWHRLRLEIRGRQLRALVDGVVALMVDDLHYVDRRGPIGLFVGDGTRGLFANLTIVPS